MFVNINLPTLILTLIFLGIKCGKINKNADGFVPECTASVISHSVVNFSAICERIAQKQSAIVPKEFKRN